MNNIAAPEKPNPNIAQYLTALRAEIGMLRIDQEKKDDALKIVNALDMQFESGRPDKVVVTDLISQLPSAAVISTINACLLSCL
ncbi:hypothetical protein ACFL3P_06080 [Pseudomonadota bacterium]